MATESKHTPGPWKAFIEQEGIWVSPPNEDDPVICDMISRLSSFDEGTQEYMDQFQTEDEANAKLIAAAPDLLEALEILLSDFEHIVRNAKGQPAYILAKEAINKALQ